MSALILIENEASRFPMTDPFPKFGSAARRTEDDAFLRGEGHYTDDIAVPGAAIAHVVRSPVAFARFKIGGLDAVRAMPGVLLVLTAADIGHIGPMFAMTRPDASGNRTEAKPAPVLCVDTVRHVGDAVAFIVAETKAQALDAAEALEISWDVLAPVAGARKALAPA